MLFLTLPPFVNYYPNEIIDIHPFGVSDSQAWIYVRPAELITFPFLSLALRDPLEITIQYHFPASVAQRPVSGTLVMENYQLAQMKWPLEKASQNISPSLSLSHSLCLSISHYLPLNLINSLFLSLALSLGGKHSFETEHEQYVRDSQFCTTSMFFCCRVFKGN